MRAILMRPRAPRTKFCGPPHVLRCAGPVPSRQLVNTVRVSSHTRAVMKLNRFSELRMPPAVPCIVQRASNRACVQEAISSRLTGPPAYQFHGLKVVSGTNLEWRPCAVNASDPNAAPVLAFTTPMYLCIEPRQHQPRALPTDTIEGSPYRECKTPNLPRVTMLEPLPPSAHRQRK
jgi:hypothetical protein